MESNIVRTNYWDLKVRYKSPFSFQSLVKALKGEKVASRYVLCTSCGCSGAPSCEVTTGPSSCEFTGTSSCEVSTSCSGSSCSCGY